MNLKRVLVILVITYLVISTWRIGAPYIKNAMFSNDLDNIARILSVEGEVGKARRQVREAAVYHGIPASDDQITVIKDTDNRQVLVEVKYAVPVKTPFGLYTHVWNFAPRAQKGLQRVPRPGG
jgi:hypothetical protein